MKIEEAVKIMRACTEETIGKEPKNPRKTCKGCPISQTARLDLPKLHIERSFCIALCALDTQLNMIEK